MLLFASQKCKTFAVLLVPAELSHRSLIFAPRGGFAAVSFFLSFSSNPLTLLYPTENAFGGGPGFIPHKTYVLRGPRLYPTENSFGGDPDLCPTENAFGGGPGLRPSVLVTAEDVFFNST